jgi:hypothetical protein
MWAAAGGHSAAVKVLLDGKADINATQSDDNYTALLWATQSASPDTVKVKMVPIARRVLPSRNSHTQACIPHIVLAFLLSQKELLLSQILTILLVSKSSDAWRRS